VELDTVDRITTDAIGDPGERTFFLQARRGPTLVTVTVEKQQVQLLAASILEILSRIGKETGQGPPAEEMTLEEPVDPMWRAGRLSIGYLEERDLILLEIEELLPEDQEGAEVVGETPQLEEFGGLEELEDPEAADEESRAADRVRLWATREQMLSLSRQGALVCARGRPTCQFCGNPLDPEGHVCPAMNGHGQLGRS
jgi:uncharacterized repeat protein (TIGR03847 family)